MKQELVADVFENEILRAYRRLMKPLQALTKSERAVIRKAFEMARDAHASQRRKSGEPYILHPLEVARIVVMEMGLQDMISVVCALLHDAVEDTEIELDDIRREFGNKAVAIVNGLTKISASPTLNDTQVSQQAETFRKILLTISDDIRVVLIKLADRLHNMRTMGAMREESMRKITAETLFIYAPLAHRLGLYEIKTELEDLSFFYSNPGLYKEIETKFAARKEEAKAYIEHFIRKIKKALKPLGLQFTVKSRYKSIYSIYSKMQRKHLPFDEIFDIYAIRIIIETREGKERDDCWQVYSTVSKKYTPNLKRIRDWITVAKENGYESLHTTVMGPLGKWVEVQIRTTRMDDVAEKGIAAHWKYKDDGEVQEDFLTEWIAQIRKILEDPKLNPIEVIEGVREKLTPNDVYAFTPKGEIVRLPYHATALDFAYKIHTRIGDTAIGAKINTQIVGLDAKIYPGDQVEILSSSKVMVKPEWQRLVVTGKARDSIRNALRKKRKETVELGQAVFQRGARAYGVAENGPVFSELLHYFLVPDAEEFYYRLGLGDINKESLREYIELKRLGKSVLPVDKALSPSPKESSDGLPTPEMFQFPEGSQVEQVVLSACCTPIYEDEIMGLRDGDKVIIHRANCRQALTQMSTYGPRIIKVNWLQGLPEKGTFLAGVRVRGLDKQGMLIDLIRVISQRMKLNMRSVTIDSDRGTFDGVFRVYVKSARELDRLISAVKGHENVRAVARVDGHGE